MELFKSHRRYIDDMEYFDEGDGIHDTKFDRGCQEIIKRFHMKWHPTESWQEYLSTFSVKSWKDLSLQQKHKHTLSNCHGCVMAHSNLQSKFPCQKHTNITTFDTS